MKRTGPGLGILAAAACAACCALPVLTAAGVLSGGTAVLLADGLPLAAALAAVAAFAWAAYRKRRGCGGSCAGTEDVSGCKCSATRA
ncbi:hypothetical protein [Actinomadura macrotermitis]|uniref:Mercuric ion transport protein n=1 Tax=Actinomadura macrotermitis TaxID=2585200 RepID=A0A7K0BX68_9ACTN|nr:hypothetical protein [Actinomadura macrotermitis]MQY05780.1 hypothetical protein [Actinomadura macrotermitis]